MESDEPRSINHRAPLRELLDEVEREIADGGTREYRKLFLAIGRVAAHLESERGTLIRVVETVKTHERIIMGTEDKPGLKNSLDALLVEMKSRRKFHYAVFTALIGLLVLKLGELLFKHFP